MMRSIVLLLFGLLTKVYAVDLVLNVYAWGGEIPKQVIQQFEAETKIRVNFSTYDSNETLYAKLRASQQGIYDVILPSSYFVERMRSQGMLTRLESKQLTHLNHLDAAFTNNTYDPHNRYSVPFLWGTTGIFYNQEEIKQVPDTWDELWKPRYKNKLMLLDDPREVFAMALMSLGYPPNDEIPQHIAQAYEKLLTLIPNIKLFSNEGIQAILIDEDAVAGIVWNGDAFKAHAENNAIDFVYPKDGFVIWVDCLAIPKNASHLKEAYAFINFLLRKKVAATIGLTQGHALTNAAGKALLPLAIQHNTLIYPTQRTLSRGYFQNYPKEHTIDLLNEYWQKFKLMF